MKRVGQLLLVAAIITLHLRLFRVGGYEVTLGFLLALAFLLTQVRRIPVGWVLAFWVPIAALSGIVAITSPIARAQDYFGTLLLFLAATLMVGLSAATPLAPIVEQRRFSSALLLALWLVVALSLMQTVLGIFDIPLLFNPWGASQFSNPYDPGLAWVTVPRAQGFYLEPSYNAFVIGSLGVALISIGRYRKQAVLLLSLGLIVTQSATGLIIAVGIAVFFAVGSRPRVAVPILMVVLTVATLAGSQVTERLQSIAETGSSGNYRVTQPIPVILDVLSDDPFGMPLGSVYQVVSQYGLIMFGETNTRSLDNGFYVLIFYFGWFGLIAIVALGVWTLREWAMRRAVDSVRWLAPAWIGASFMFSGAIMAPEFAFMTGLVVIGYRCARWRDRDWNSVGEAVERYCRKLQRPRGPRAHTGTSWHT